MKNVIWFLPADLVPPIATLLIMLGGFALMFGQKALAISSIVSAVALLMAPLFDPLIDQGVDTAVNVGDVFVRQSPWWLIAGVLLVTLFLLLRAILNFIFGKEAADHAVGILLAQTMRAVFRTVILGPIRLVIALVRVLMR
jgi:uncharacterized membrane protein YbhN (UPF0104 family)